MVYDRKQKPLLKQSLRELATDENDDEKVNKVAVQSERVLDVVLKTFFQLVGLVLKMTIHLITLFINGIKNKIKNKNKRADH